MALRTNHTLFDELAQFYDFKGAQGDPSAVARFIEQYPAIADALAQARGALQRLFPEGAYHLQVKRDPDINDEQLILSIGVKRDPAAPHDGVKRLLRLQEEWGLDANRHTEGNFAVILESL